MTTVPLSRRIDALFGIRVDAISGPFSPLPVHPESPVLLTKTSPPTIVDFTSGVRSGDPGSLPVRSSRIGRGHYGPGTSSRSLYRSKRFRDGRYPEGNFGGNQLLGGSIGLSPLFARRTNDLHVSTVDGPPPGFPPASPRARIDQANLNANAVLIKGVICGYRIEEIENPLTKQVRYLDKLVDELAKGKEMQKILRKAS